SRSRTKPTSAATGSCCSRARSRSLPSTARSLKRSSRSRTKNLSVNIMISCGEASGDLYAGALTRELRARVPNAEIVGFGGEHLRAAGAELVGDFTGLTVTG